MGSIFIWVAISKFIIKLLKIPKNWKALFLMFLSFFKKICQSEEPPLPLSKQFPPFSPIPPFLEKIFHPHPNFQIRGSQPPFPFVKGGSNYVMDKLF